MEKKPQTPAKERHRDAELAAMSKISGIMSEIPPEIRLRILTFFAAREKAGLVCFPIGQAMPIPKYPESFERLETAYHRPQLDRSVGGPGE